MRTTLLADDEEILRLLVHETLNGPDCRLIEAQNGREALRKAQADMPDLIILDWMMPGITGPEVARCLRAQPQTARIPVILLTARTKDADRAEGFASGANAFLSKKFSPLELLDKVDESLGAAFSGKAARLPSPFLARTQRRRSGWRRIGRCTHRREHTLPMQWLGRRMIRGRTAAGLIACTAPFRQLHERTTELARGEEMDHPWRRLSTRFLRQMTNA